MAENQTAQAHLLQMNCGGLSPFKRRVTFPEGDFTLNAITASWRKAAAHRFYAAMGMNLFHKRII